MLRMNWKLGICLTGIVVGSILLPTLYTSAQTVEVKATGSHSTTTDAGYILGSGDQIEINVYGYSEYSGARVILADGTISLPVIGSVVVANHTPTSLAKMLESRLNRVLVEPTVTVSMVTLRPVVINIAGEVQRPGPFQLRSLTTAASESSGARVVEGQRGLPTLTSALMEAGGVTRNADIRQVMLRRVLADGQVKTMIVNLWDTIWSDQHQEDLILRSGDSIYVPKLAADATLDRRLLARSRLSPMTVRVRIVGEVRAPGEVQVSPDSTLSGAIASAGGFTKDAKASEIELLRLNDAGQVEAQKIDLRKLNDQYQIQEGDVVVVPEKSRAAIARTVGQILSPFGALLRFITGF
ncbi:polysaccharide biosynthesis/export family protein [Leptolyngbya sp. UWPOB_LEPTO1]|uniref:polysaccharide biosynthesis/export family protein n=1 Tax=Leptolyngbya sp. UWPOB_LEPTO1 TaxID=2815653 RepID=UPI00257EADF2|nr:polysaccharide biosynthesis/export family protein [Leptolyngbya sp. UWPOB_LEPTO1]